jgi:hypothetical protein
MYSNPTFTFQKIVIDDDAHLRFKRICDNRDLSSYMDKENAQFVYNYIGTLNDKELHTSPFNPANLPELEFHSDPETEVLNAEVVEL